MASNLEIDRTSPTPAGEQLRQAIRRDIAMGSLRPGAQIFSVRDMAKALGISATTVQKAYNDLIQEGLIVGRVGVGMFVAPLEPKVTWEDRHRILAEKCDAFITDAVLLGLRATALRKFFFERERLYGPKAFSKPIPRPRGD